MEISVIAATYNREALLRKLLAALSSQDFPKQLYEIIVINDGSTDGTGSVLEKSKTTLGVELTVINQQNRGPAAARNAGISLARGRIIAFTDDDCIPDTNWLSAIHQFFQKSKAIGLQGSTYTERNKITPLTHQIDNEKGNKSVPTCNAAYLTDLLRQIGGFDDHFPYPHNEDADLAWRAQQKGAILFAPEVRVFHPVRPDAFKKVARRMRILESEFRLYYKNKESYRLNRSSSPWRNIYWEIGVLTQWYYLKSRFKFWRDPTLVAAGLAISMLWWIDLIRLLPIFIKANKSNQAEFEKLST